MMFSVMGNSSICLKCRFSFSLIEGRIFSVGKVKELLFVVDSFNLPIFRIKKVQGSFLKSRIAYTNESQELLEKSVGIKRVFMHMA